ncbi:unnamed protein product, partial [Effrenium voratum]
MLALRFLLALALCNCIEAIRTRQGELERHCPEATRHEVSRTRFRLGAKELPDVLLWQDWVLKEAQDCTGPQVGNATVVPWVHSEDPRNSSTVSIHVQVQGFSQLYVCPSSGVQCLASINIREHGLRISDVLGLFISKKTVHAVQNLDPTVLFVFEMLLLGALSCLLVIVIWFGLLLHDQGHHWGLLEATKASPFLKLPSSSDILLQGAIDVLFFVLGCALFVAEAERFFQKYPDPIQLGYIVVLLFPLLFGSVAVLRICLATARCQLYHASLRHGIVLKFQHAPSYFDPLLLWFWMGLVLTVGKAVHVLLVIRGDLTEELSALLVFMSPLYYMTSSIFDILHSERSALEQLCTVVLTDIAKGEPIHIGEGMSCMDDSTFCQLARERRTISASDCPDTSDDGAGSNGFNVTDLSWVGPLLANRSGSQRLQHLLFDPMMTLSILCLAVLSGAVCLHQLIHQPELTKLSVIGGALSSKFQPNYHEYNILVDRGQTMMALAAEADAREGTMLEMQDSGSAQKESSSGASLAQAVSLAQDHYPLNLKIDAWDTTQHNTYGLQVLKSGFLPESVTLWGHDVKGRRFYRCLPWGSLWQRPSIHVPYELQELNMNISIRHYVMGIPRRLRPDSFSTQMLENISQQECQHFLRFSPYVAVGQHTKGNCFAVMQPTWDLCGSSSLLETEHFQQLHSARFSSQLCPGDMACLSAADVAEPVLSFTNMSIMRPNDREQRLSVRLSVDMRGSTFSIIDEMNFYGAPDIHLRKGWPFAKDILGIYVFSDTGPALSVKPNGFQWSVTIKDSASFKTQKDLNITVVSSDLDCEVISLYGSFHASTLEEVETPKEICLYDVSAMPCPMYGWKPTRTFRVDLDMFRRLLLSDAYKKALYFLSGTTTCYSVQEQLGQEQITVSLRHVPGVKLGASIHVPNRPGLNWHLNRKCTFDDSHHGKCEITMSQSGIVNSTQGDLAYLSIIYKDPDVDCLAEWQSCSDGMEVLHLESAHLPPSACESIWSSTDKALLTEACGGSWGISTAKIQLAPLNPMYKPELVSYTQVEAKLHCNTFINPRITVGIWAYGKSPAGEEERASPSRRHAQVICTLREGPAERCEDWGNNGEETSPSSPKYSSITLGYDGEKTTLRPWDPSRCPFGAAIYNRLIHFPIRPKGSVFAIFCSLQSLSHLSDTLGRCGHLIGVLNPDSSRRPKPDIVHRFLLRHPNTTLIFEDINVASLERYERLLSLPVDSRYAFLMALHPRLGAQSPARLLKDDAEKLCNNIFKFLVCTTPSLMKTLVLWHPEQSLQEESDGIGTFDQVLKHIDILQRWRKPRVKTEKKSSEGEHSETNERIWIFMDIRTDKTTGGNLDMKARHSRRSGVCCNVEAKICRIQRCQREPV